VKHCNGSAGSLCNGAASGDARGRPCIRSSIAQAADTLAASLVPFCAISGCAKKPENIEAAPINNQTYSSFSCKQLTGEKLKNAQGLESLSAAQNQAASSDAWGVFLIGLPVSSMSGNDKEAAISIAKGNIQTIDRVRVAKGCA
jgi:hypothetical protein